MDTFRVMTSDSNTLLLVDVKKISRRSFCFDLGGRILAPEPHSIFCRDLALFRQIENVAYWLRDNKSKVIKIAIWYAIRSRSWRST